ncbi:precorrin-2 dehydrogenase/sirohydrochlorin ferrochelatase family protein [Halorientalis sp.]|jgi:precorrin-2 dehydrogenase/sirohydrochlorin ferrochelatase|uniref:precorrin-2 dehydrogenase/sirohydrochlorin ferrochelatase family protein n=1 Tax=Halorientalis sp. TaxID=1931229 RepID=UPI00263027A1|nr:bifunctional precorrin-2 dehydrogenase/sirohydrochlorin ferrochelatase [Halorientalis sp.]
MIPLLHDFTDTTVLVFGGGSVGARKARRFTREADVIVVSPAFADTDFGGAERVRAAPDTDDVTDWVADADPALVVAATDDGELNGAIERAARDAGALVNRTDEHGERDSGSVVVPATVRDGPVTVAISTGGTSPALSRYLRQRIEDDVDGAGEMARLTGELRAELQADAVDPERRRNAVRAVVRSARVWKHLDSGRTKRRQVAEDVIADVTGDLQ